MKYLLLIFLLTSIKVAGQKSVDSLKADLMALLKDDYKNIDLDLNEVEISDFDIDKLIIKHIKPKIFSDDPAYHEHNETVFQELLLFNKDNKISYSVKLSFGYRENISDSFNIEWLVLFLDSNYKILKYVIYYP